MMSGLAFGRFRQRYPALMLCGLLGALSACSEDKSWNLTDVSKILPPLEFTLTNTSGQTVDASAYRGKVTLLFFGYTHCPDVCPTTLAEISQAINKLGPQADGVRALFVTVDPKRDKPELLRTYTRAFGPQVVGLRGTDEQLRKLAQRYHVAYSLGDPDKQGNYAVTHSGTVFIFDKQGRAQLLAVGGNRSDLIAQDLHQLIEQT